MQRRLLLIDDVATNRIVLRAKLAAAGYAVDMAGDLDGARDAIATRLPDVVLISSTVADPETPKLARLLMAGAGGARIPVIALDAGQGEFLPGPALDAIVRAPVSDVLILARLRSILRIRDLEDELALRASTCRELGLAEDPQPFERASNVVLVPQRTEDGTRLAQTLTLGRSAKISVVKLPGLFAGLERRGAVDVIVIDTNPETPALDLHLLSDLRCRAETRHAAIILRLPETAQTEAAMALDLGAADVILGDPGPAYLSACIRQQLDRQFRIQTLRQQVSDGLRLAVIDPLTGLYNRRYAFSHLERLVKHSAETGRALAVMILDIDRFKSINDTYGHQNGDRVIQAVGNLLSDNLRTADLVCRFGGEEFLITMSDTTVEEARTAADRIRRKVADMQVPLLDGKRVAVTLSIGLTVQTPRTDAADKMSEVLIRDADAALYVAKADGRNQVSLRQVAA